MLKAGAVKTKRGYVPLIVGRHRVAAGSYGIQKTQRLRGLYPERQDAVQAAQAHLDRVATGKARWAAALERSKADRINAAQE
jgi:hypothetical protein